MAKIEKLELKDVYILERNIVIKELGKVLIDIATLEREDPEKVIGTRKKPLSVDKDGNALSYEKSDLKVGEVLKDRKEEEEGYMIRLKTVERLIQKA